jgi:PAS domain S-box-containing protein
MMPARQNELAPLDQDSSNFAPAPSAEQAFADWVPCHKERKDLIEVAAYHIAQRNGFKMDPHECWNAGEAQIDLMLSLRENQLKLQTILDNSLDAVVMIDTGSIVTGWNPQAARTFGWTREEALGQPLHDMIIPPAQREAHVRGIKQFLTTGTGPCIKTLVEVRALHRDGHEFPIELTIAPVRSTGKLEFSAFIRDITERKRFEGVQTARLRLLGYAADHSLKELLIATLDEAGALTDSPIGFYHFLEADQKTLSLQAWSTRTTREFCTAAGEGSHYNIDDAGVWVECVRQRRPVIHNDYAALPDKRGLPPGHAMVLREMVVPVFRKGLIVAILGVGNKATPYLDADLETVTKLADLAWDIAEGMRADAELARSNTELEQFSYAVSHDMRQPLRMISSYLQLLDKDLGATLDTEKREYLNFAVDGAKRLDQMLVGLLEYSRVGRQGEPPEWLDSRTLLDEAMLFLEPSVEEAHAEVRIEGDWPKILASPNEILRLLQNLIGNALKFRVAERSPVIVARSEKSNKEWCVSIFDNGVGIIPDQIGRLFQVFQRLQSRSAYEGNGIGLALCRKIVEHHGGRIWAESAGEGQGSRFCFSLPQQDFEKHVPNATDAPM